MNKLKVDPRCLLNQIIVGHGSLKCFRNLIWVQIPGKEDIEPVLNLWCYCCQWRDDRQRTKSHRLEHTVWNAINKGWYQNDTGFSHEFECLLAWDARCKMTMGTHGFRKR